MPNDAEDLRSLEQERLAAFVAKDIPTLQRLHANDFQLVNPAGQELNRDDYLNGIAQGFIDYKRWDIDGRIQAYVFGEVAILRYRSVLELAVQGEAQPEQRFWQVEVYEKRRDGWQAVFSQATRINL